MVSFHCPLVVISHFSEASLCVFQFICGHFLPSSLHFLVSSNNYLWFFYVSVKLFYLVVVSLYHFSLWSSCIFLFCAWFSFECRFIAARWALRLSKKILHLLTQHLCPVCHYTLVNYNYNWKTSIISVSMKKRDGKENPHIHCELISHMDLFFFYDQSRFLSIFIILLLSS